MANDNLNRKQKKFLELYLSGVMPTESYQEAYNSSQRVARVNAYKLLENTRIKVAIEEFEKREEERVRKRLDRLTTKAVDNVESAMSLDEDDPSLNFFKIMAIQHKTKTAENHLKRMGFDSPNKVQYSGSVEFSVKDIIYGTAEDNEDNQEDDN